MKQDLKNELYALSSELYNEVSKNILSVLGFEITEWDYFGSIESFIYGYCEEHNIKRELTSVSWKKIENIAVSSLKFERKKMYIIASNVTNNIAMRNDEVILKAHNIRKILGRENIFVFISDNSFCFAGYQYNYEKGKYEIVISEWFYYEMDDEKYEKLLEIDPSLYDLKSKNRFYEDYIFSIAREYVKRPVSKIFLTYACEFIYSDELLSGEDGAFKVDFKETYDHNYAELMKPYFYDEYSVDLIQDYDDLDDELDDLDWTLLEMELDEEALLDESDDVEDLEYNSLKSEFDDRDDDRDIFDGLTPLEMLNIIRSK